MPDDFRAAFRGLARVPALSAVLLISLGLGTGANVAVFGTMQSLLFRPPPGIADASSLVEIFTRRHDGSIHGPSSYADFESLLAAHTPVEAIAAVQDDAQRDLPIAGATVRVRVGRVSDCFFEVLGMKPLAGRLLSGADLVTPRAVLSAELSKSLGGPGDSIGKSLTVGEETYTVVGIAPEGFRGLRRGRTTDVWIPLDRGQTQRNRGDRKLALLARLMPGRGLDEVQRVLDTVAADLAEQYPDTNRGTARHGYEPRTFTAVNYSALDPATREQTTVVAAVIAGAVVLLLIGACVNAGSLLVSRAVARRREVAVKLALGASRTLLIRQFLVETLVISTAGAAVGLLFAYWTLHVIPSLFAPEQAELLDTRLDVRLVLITVVCAAAAGGVMGIVPALQGTADSPAVALRGDSGEIAERRGSPWVRGSLLITQIALSVVLLLGTGLLVSSVSHALEGDLGFTARNILFVRIPTGATTANQNELAAALEPLEDVEAVAWASTPPLTRGAVRTYRIEAGDGSSVMESIDVGVSIVSPPYFQTIRLPIVDGRAFDASDHGLADPVVIIDETLASRYFPRGAVGRSLLTPEGLRLQIIGVARGGRYRTLQESPFPTVYYSTRQEGIARAYVLVRTRTDPAIALHRITRQLQRSGILFEEASTLESRLAASLALDRLVMTLVAACGVIALLMSTVGIYGVINDAVRRRTREIGLRVALGAGRPQVVRLVLSEAVAFTAAGILIGVAAALSVERFATGLVEDLPGMGPGILTATPGILVLAVAAAAVVPLQRALRVSPSIALRAE